MRDRPNGWTKIRGFLRKLQPREELPQAALPSGRLGTPAQRRTKPSTPGQTLWVGSALRVTLRCAVNVKHHAALNFAAPLRSPVEGVRLGPIRKRSHSFDRVCMCLKDKIAIVVGAGQSPGEGLGNGRGYRPFRIDKK